MSTLWLLLVPVCTALYTLLLPIAPNDFWYHARAGAEIMATGKIPTVALFSSSTPHGTPYFYQSWIAEIALYETMLRGGLAWIVILRTFCLVLSFALLQFAVWRRLRRVAPEMGATTLARWAALSTLLAFALSAANMDIRPQTFSVPLFCAFVLAFYEWPFLAATRRSLAVMALTLLMVLWANTHGAFFTGLILLGVLLAAEFLYAASTRRTANPVPIQTLRAIFGASQTRWQLRALGALLLLGAGAALVNPRGIEIYNYVFLLARDKSSQKFIQEWQTPSITEWYGALFYFTVFLLCALLGVLSLRTKSEATSIPKNGEAKPLGSWGVRASELLVVAALAVMALRDARSIIWFGLGAAPLLAVLLLKFLNRQDLNSQPRRSTPAREPERVPRSVQVVNAILLLFLIFAPVPFLPWFKSALPLPPEYSRKFAPNPRGEFPAGFGFDPPLLLERNTPVEAVELMRQTPPRGKLWNDFVFGSYLVWATLYEPRLAPHVDPRVEMHPLEFWEEYGRVAAGPGDAARTLERNGFTDALLDAAEQPKLLRHLQENGWRILWPKLSDSKQSTPQAPRSGAVLLRRED